MFNTYKEVTVDEEEYQTMVAAKKKGKKSFISEAGTISIADNSQAAYKKII